MTKQKRFKGKTSVPTVETDQCIDSLYTFNCYLPIFLSYVLHEPQRA